MSGADATQSRRSSIGAPAPPDEASEGSPSPSRIYLRVAAQHIIAEGSVVHELNNNNNHHEQAPEEAEGAAHKICLLYTSDAADDM
eukprot:1681468-Prymnesium_polylepis.1